MQYSTEYVPAKGIQELYPDSYFQRRVFNDDKRLRQFELERQFLRKYIAGGRVLDVGCSTGEFLLTMEWQGEMYGMEISDYARKMAEQNGVCFNKHLFNQQEFFDCVVFRGTIQQLDEPFRFIKLANRALRTGGYIVFLATPNIDSIMYRLKKRLPFVASETCFYLPDRVNFTNALKNFGFEICEVRFPYWKSPYRRFFHDHWRFLRNMFSRKYYPHPFWGNSMEVIARKVRTV